MIASLKAATMETLNTAEEGFDIVDLEHELGFFAAFREEMMSRVKAVELPFAAERDTSVDMDIG
jgi:hypothetical protein